jgi:hypothetical protein
MMRRLASHFAGLVFLFLGARASPTWAGPTDARAIENRLEDQWLDGDRDLEDLASMRVTPDAIGGGRAPSAYVAIEGFSSRRTAQNREVGALLVIQLPFERMFSRSPPRFALAAETSAAPPAPGRASAVVVDMNVTRACVAAALRAVGLADDARIDGMAARSRSSALLPELRLRAMRSVDESGRITLSEIDPSRYTETGGATDWIEARLTFRLDRLLFADDEVTIERIRLERSEQRSRATARVIEALFEWQRAYLLARDPDLATDDHVAALLRELEAAARLDVMTDGWFGRYRSGLKVLPL